MVCLLDVNTSNKRKEVYYKYYPQLVEALPMKDPIFLSKLVSLLPGNDKATIESKPTPADAASYILDNIIEPSVETGDNKAFDILLSNLEESDNVTLQNLAQHIRQETQSTLRNDPIAGKNIHSPTHSDITDKAISRVCLV